MTYLKQIRKYCLHCCLGNSYEVRLCQVTKCTLHPYRSGHKNNDAKYTALKSIRRKCLDCATSSVLVKECWNTKCPLFELRFGKNKKRSIKNPTEKQIKQREEALRMAQRMAYQSHRIRYG